MPPLPPERAGARAAGRRPTTERTVDVVPFPPDVVPDWIHVRVPGGYRTVLRATRAQAKQRGMATGRMAVGQAQDNIIRDIYDETEHIEHDTIRKGAMRRKVSGHDVVGVG